MAKSVATLDRGATCSSWNYCGQRLASGSVDGNVAVFDTRDPAASSSLTCTSKFKVNDAAILKIVWVPPEYGDAVACICMDGSLSLWEEVVEDAQTLQWKLRKSFKSNSSQVLDVQFGGSSLVLRMVSACSAGRVKVYDLLDPLDLRNWQLQAEFQNVIDSVSNFGKASCLSASVSWNPRRGEGQESSFVLGFNSNTPQLNSSKVWEFDLPHQRWLPVAELSLPGDKGDQVYAVAWAPNIGDGSILFGMTVDLLDYSLNRPYELIAVATHKGIAIWHVGLAPDLDGRLSVEKVALLSGHEGEGKRFSWANMVHVQETILDLEMKTRLISTWLSQASNTQAHLLRVNVPSTTGEAQDREGTMVLLLSSCLHCKVPGFTSTGRHLASSSSFLLRPQAISYGIIRDFKSYENGSRRRGIVCEGFLPVDPWAPTMDSQSIASQLFAASLFPYLGFLFYITKSKTAPNITLFGFYFLLAFVGATIPAGIYAKVHYGTSLSNVDWLHGGAESLLTLTNLFIVLGLRQALRQAKDSKQSTMDTVSQSKGQKKPSI